MTEQTVGPDRLVGLEIGGKYKIVGLLGEGGMGCVYKGEQKLGNTIRKVAIKTLHEHLSHDPQILARFEREVGTVAGLQHPNTIQVFDFGKMDDGTLYIVMEFVEGKSVANWLEQGGPMEPARVVNILKQVCGSLEEAHGLGIVHRDLKPDNIVLCDKAGQHDWVEVLDFGIAKRSNETDEKEQKLTQQGMVLGTPPYMSPEQFTGRPVDRRSDIYSLSVMAYEMLTGGLPFNGNTAWEWATAHMTAQPRPLETFPISTRIPPAMKAAILRGLEKDPLRRPQTVTEFFNMFSTGAGAGPSVPDYSLVPGGMATPPPITGQPVYGQGQTQPGAPLTAGGVVTPVPGYQTGQVYMTPAQGAHTYTPQPFPQMATPPPVQEKKGGSALGIIAVLLGLLILVGGGIGLAYSQGIIGKTGKTAPTDTSKVATTAPDTVTAATVTPNPTDTGPIEGLAVDAGKTPNTNSFVGQNTNTVHKDAGAVAVNTAPTYTATQPTYTNTAPTYTPTYTPTTPTYTATAPTYNAGAQPPECAAARLMKSQGQERQAAQLAIRCMRKGGAPPF